VKRETKRRKPTTGSSLRLLRLVARAIRRGVLTDAALFKLCDHEDDMTLCDDHSFPLSHQLMTLLRDLAEGRRDPAVILGQKPRRGRKSNARQRAAVVAAYWVIRRALSKSRKPHIDTCKALREQYPKWQYTDGTLRQWVKAAGPEGRSEPATIEDFDIIPLPSNEIS
jgi:hypothetical protein